jgi:ADP-ribose pyrophosphatase YjhB (NUDIX family)
MGRRIFSYDYEMFVRDPFRFGSTNRSLRKRFANMLVQEKDEIRMNMDLAYHIWRVTKNATPLPKIRLIFRDRIDAFNRRFGLKSGGAPNPVQVDGHGVVSYREDTDHRTIDLIKLCDVPTRPYPNVWEFPKGICKAGENEKLCALREFEEEVGGNPARIQFLETSSTKLAEKFYGTDRTLYEYLYFPSVYNGELTGGDGELVRVAVYPIYMIAALSGPKSPRYKCIQYFLKKYGRLINAALL